MQQNLVRDEARSVLNKVTCLVGSIDTVLGMSDIAPKSPFSEEIIEFLQDLSKHLLKDREAKAYPDVVTLGFWIRKASLMELKERFCSDSDVIRVGRGVAFHIAPSNVPINYAFSLVSGLLTGNANIVRVPSKDFDQVRIVNSVIASVLKDHPEIAPYISLVRYEREQEINDFFSAMADVRIIWGGDATIQELRKSPMAPRATEITFADRYSLAVIDSDLYLSLSDKKRFAEDFYNDTFISDQNACTSPRVVIWTGKSTEKAKALFWETEHELVKQKYTFQAIMGMNKLTNAYLVAAENEGIQIVSSGDNLILRIKITSLERSLMARKESCGFFFEYDCDDLLSIRDFVNDTHCQTIGYLGEKEKILPLLSSGIRGVDRVVPIGSTMDFDLQWDGYNLFERLTRGIQIGV